MAQAYSSGDPTSDDKTLSAVGYIIPLVALIMLLMEDKKSRPFIRYHAVQSLALTVVLGVLTSVLACLLAAVTFFIAGAGGFLGLAPWLVIFWPAYEAFNGKYVELPFITNFIKKQNWV